MHSGTDDQFHVTCSHKQLLILVQGMGTHCGIMPKTPFNTAQSCDHNNCAKGHDACYTWLHPVCPGMDSQPPGGDSQLKISAECLEVGHELLLRYLEFLKAGKKGWVTTARFSALCVMVE